LFARNIKQFLGEKELKIMKNLPFNVKFFFSFLDYQKYLFTEVMFVCALFKFSVFLLAEFLFKKIKKR